MEDIEQYVDNILEKIKNSDITSSKKDKQCAPANIFEHGSCLKLPILIKLVKAYNIDSSDKIKIDDTGKYLMLKPNKYKKYLIYQLKRKIGSKCSTQKCWLTQDFTKHLNNVMKKELGNTWRPESPQGQFTWLTTTHIDDVINQYKNIYKDFHFFGAVPMDFGELSYYKNKIYDYNFQENYNNGTKKYGIVYNLDNHDQGGSHWTSMFMDLEKKHIFYFDSCANRPEDRVRKFVRLIARNIKSIHNDTKDMKVDYNKVVHQQGDTECGVYSINFIVKMLKHGDFYKICNSPVSDDKMNVCRKVYFH